jgi:hypothetical protein
MIEKANATPESDTITFSSRANVIPVIHLQSALPDLEGGITFIGAKKAGSAKLRIQGPEALFVSGLTLSGNENVLRRLEIGGFLEAGIKITGDNNIVDESTLGGSAPNNIGILIHGDRNVIGNTNGVPGNGSEILGNPDAFFSNKISSNTGPGILLAAASDGRMPDGNEIYRTNSIYNGGADISVSGGTNLQLGSPTGANRVGLLRIAGNDTRDVSLINNLFGSLVVEGGAQRIRVGENSNAEANEFGSVRVLDGSGVQIGLNELQSIDIGLAGPNSNDALDGDSGANGLLNHPVIDSVEVAFGKSKVLGHYEGAANKEFRALFYKEVRMLNYSVWKFIGETTFLTDEGGHAEWEALTSLPERDGVVSSYVIDVETGDTSEMSWVYPMYVDTPLISISDAELSERDATAVMKFFLQLSGSSFETVSVLVTASSLTALAGQDFTFASQTVTFNPGQKEASLLIPIVGDLEREEIESFKLTLSNPFNGVVMPEADSALGRIRDDDHSLVISANKRLATWTDVDGDLVILRASKPILAEHLFTFVSSTQIDGGDQLAKLDLRSTVGGDLTFSVKTVENALGDGLVNVGFIEATGVNLGRVTIPGDLGQIRSGGSHRGHGIAALKIESMGAEGLGTQAATDFPAEASLTSIFSGGFGTINIAGNLEGATIRTAALDPGRPKISSSIVIGGAMIGGDEPWSGSIDAEDFIQRIQVKGALMAGEGAWSGAIRVEHGIGSVVVQGGVFGDTTGSDDSIGAASISAAGKIGAVKTIVLAGGLADRSGSIFTDPGSAADIGSVTVGSLSGRSHNSAGTPIFTGISSAGNIGSMRIGEILGAASDDPVQIIAAGRIQARSAADAVAIGSLSVTEGGVANLRMLAGYDLEGSALSPYVRIGTISVAGDWDASTVLAGASLNGSGTAVLPIAGVLNTADVGSRIAAITIRGLVAGSEAAVSSSDLFGFFAKEIVSFKSGGESLPLARNRPGILPDNFLVGDTEDTLVREVV